MSELEAPTVPPVWPYPLSIRTLIEFAAAHPSIERAETTIRRELGVHPVRYAQLLNRAIDREEALQVDATTTHALLRRRAEARAQRAQNIGGTQ